MNLPKIRHKPTLPYSGITIVLQHPSRFDVHELLCGAAGHFFKTECLRPDIVHQQCDVRTSNTLSEGLLNGTKAILLLGHKAMLEWAGRNESQYKDYTLNEQRGCPLENKWNLPMIATFFPQDAMDLKDYEKTHNQFIQGEDLEILDENEEEDEGAVKRKGKTRRSNYRFWIIADTKKLLSCVLNEVPTFAQKDETIPHSQPVIYPQDLESVINKLNSTTNETLYIDIECHPETKTLYCIGFCFSSGSAYVVPVFLYTGLLAYNRTRTCKFLSALAVAMANNTTVCHNGFTFDLLVLAHKYGIPFGRRNEDTMMMNHRCFPELEKSLGHCISLWTWEGYHKDEGCYEPHSDAQQTALWHYNAKDVTTMRSVRNAILKYSSRVVGLRESIAQANKSIYAYCVNSLYGMAYRNEMIVEVQKEYDGLMTQYLRMCRLLLGYNFLPSSSKDVPKYFHDKMNYAVVARTKKGNPSLGKGALYKLKLKYPQNIVIDICLAYRGVSKASGSLKFIPWKSPNISHTTSSGQIEIESKLSTKETS